jgi:membrane-bound lytic murein transglycosylase F
VHFVQTESTIFIALHTGHSTSTNAAISFMHRIIFIILLIILLGYTASPPVVIPPAAPKILTELVVLTVNSPASYYEDADGNFRGLDHDLAQAFARYLNVPVRFQVMEKTEEIFHALEKGQANLAAAALTVTPPREKLAHFAAPYQTATTQVIARVDEDMPKDAAHLVNAKVHVTPTGGAFQSMVGLKQQFPNLLWREAGELSEDDLLQKLEDGEIDVAVGDSHLFALSRNYFPDIKVMFELGQPAPVAWALPLKDPYELLPKANAFMEKIRADGTLKRLIDRYYGHVAQLKRDDISTLIERTTTILPRYKQYFWQAQQRTGIDWRLLAAVAYQESHWDPLATSYTGVRGMMMLTVDTAERMKVADRLDARQSILGGADYLLTLRDESLPARIPEPDRTWLALAAYNQGLGHLEDARILAQNQKFSPDAWLDVKLSLPSIASPRFYKKLKHGYGRGEEAVQFVENIRNYYDILLRLEKPYEVMQQAFDDGPIAPRKADPRTAVLKVVNLPKRATEPDEEEMKPTLTAAKANKALPTPEEIAAVLSGKPIKALPAADEVSATLNAAKPAPTKEAEASPAPADKPSAPQE